MIDFGADPQEEAQSLLDAPAMRCLPTQALAVLERTCYFVR
jgi:hypothetical protein